MVSLVRQAAAPVDGVAGLSVIDVPKTRQINLLSTSQCTAACDHCSVRSSPQRKERVPIETTVAVLDQLAEIGDLELVNFAGGEPTLGKAALYTAIRRASALGFKTRMVTNASWATTPASARRILTKLREAGLDELNISADDFHLPFIPIQRVAIAWHATKSLGFSSVAIINCVTRSSVVDAQFLLDLVGAPDTKAQTNLDGNSVYVVGSTDNTQYVISTSPALRLGRAGEAIDADEFVYADSSAAISGPCPYALTSIALSPTGKLVACCSIEAERYGALTLGDANSSPIDALLDSARTSLFPRVMATLGPVAVMDFISQRSDQIPFRDRYTSMCELCEHLVSSHAAVAFLQAHSDDLTILEQEARVERLAMQSATESCAD